MTLDPAALAIRKRADEVASLPIVRDRSNYDPRKAGARCDLCPLKGNNIVPPKPSTLPTKIVFVGEAPGRKEEIHGQPFIGQTGVFLRGIAREYGIDMREAFLQNAALCRSNIDRENDEAAVCCSPRLLKELAKLDPKIPIVTLGKSSTLSVLGVRSIMHARGFVWTAREIDPANAWKEAEKAKAKNSPKWKQLHLKAQIYEGRSKLAGRTVLPTLHPAFILRSDTWYPILRKDIERIARWLRGELRPEHLLDNGSYVVVSKRDEIRRELRKLGDVIAVDVETGESAPGAKDGADPLRNRLLCVGVSDGKHTVVIWPWRKTHAPLLNSLFRRVQKIGMHNGYNFDQIVLARNGVPYEPIEDKLEDTLIAHHAFASHMPQRLAHVASFYCDISPWKITFKRGSGAEEKGLPPDKLSAEDLCKYNAADVRIQARVWLEMQADLASEQMVYAVDKANARLCRNLIMNGIGVDLQRRAELRAAMLAKEADLLDKMRQLLRRPNFHPMQLSEVRRALFTTLRAPLAAADPTDTGLPSTSSTTLERLKGSATRAGRFADWLLQWRGVVKIRTTYCNPPEAPMWMSDGSFKSIGEIRIGDEVMGWKKKQYNRSRKFWLCGAKVTAIHRHKAPVVKVTMASGRTIRCTPDHLWLRGIAATRHRSRGPWAQARVGGTLAHIVDQPKELPLDMALRARWLGGMFDGEGSCASQGAAHRRTLDIAQSESHNPEICTALTETIQALGLRGGYSRGTKGQASHWRIGTRQSITNFLHWCRPVHRLKAARALHGSLMCEQDQIVSIENDGFEEVVGLTTETGNYIVWGYASKNCDTQILDKPSKKTPLFTRTHFNWRSYGASSGRYSCRLQSCPRAEYLKDKSIVLETRIREVYVARPGCKLVYFDLSQAEMRSAAYSSGDPTFIQTCQGDIHSGNAKILFPSEAQLIQDEPKGRGKPFRDVAKNAGFGVTYLAETDTVFQFLRSKGFDVHYQDVVVMMDRMHEAYAGYFRYVQNNVRFVGEHGYMRSLLTGRIRWLGWHAPPTEVANFPIQSMIADLMNDRLPKIEAALPAGCKVVAQIHDAAIIEVPEKKVDDVQALIKRTWDEPVIVPAGGQYGGSLDLNAGARSFVMPIDLKCKERWSDL